MNSPLDLTLDKQAFLHWAEGREGHFELKGSRVVMMTGGTRNHAYITQEIVFILRRQLDPARWRVVAADLAVAIGADIRYPDIVVEPASALGSALSTDHPVLLAEILSPSSLALDFHVKAAEYMSLASLEAYLVAAQDEARVWLWQRPEGGAVRPFPKEPQEFAGAAASLHINALKADISLADIYRGIALPPVP